MFSGEVDHGSLPTVVAGERLSSVLFDLDCTLLDRDESLARFCDRFYAEMVDRFSEQSASPEAVLAVLRDADRGGYAARATVCAQLCERIAWRDPPKVAEILGFWNASFADCAVIRPGVTAVLDRLRRGGVRLALVSNGSSRMQRRKLATVGLLTAFDSIVISGEVGLRKPDPRIYRLALQALQSPAADACFVGDHPHLDVAGARAAGLQTVWFEGVHPWPDRLERADHAIRHFDELRGILEMRF